MLAALASSARLFQKRTLLYPKLFWPIEVLKRGIYRLAEEIRSSLLWVSGSKREAVLSNGVVPHYEELCIQF